MTSKMETQLIINSDGSDNFIEWQRSIVDACSLPSSRYASKVAFVLKQDYATAKKIFERDLDVASTDEFLKKDLRDEWKSRVEASRSIWIYVMSRLTPALVDRIQRIPAYVDLVETSQYSDPYSLLNIIQKEIANASFKTEQEVVMGYMREILNFKMKSAENINDYVLRFERIMLIAKQNPPSAIFESNDATSADHRFDLCFKESFLVLCLMDGLSPDYKGYIDPYKIPSSSTSGKKAFSLPQSIQAFLYGAMEYIASNPPNSAIAVNMTSADTPTAKPHCTYCKYKGHTRDACRKRLRKEGKAANNGKPVVVDPTTTNVSIPPKSDGSSSKKRDRHKKQKTIDGNDVASHVTITEDVDDDDPDGIPDYLIFHNKILSGCMPQHDNYVLLDNCSQASIVRNQHLLSDIQSINDRVNITTTVGTTEMVFTQAGTLTIGGIKVRAYYVPSSKANIVCQHQLETQALLHGMTLNKKANKPGSIMSSTAYEIQDGHGNTVAAACWRNKLPTFELHPVQTISSHLTASGEHMPLDKLSKAHAAREAQRRLGHMAESTLQTLITSNGIATDVLRSHVRWATQALGPDVAATKGKTTRKVIKINRKLVVPDSTSQRIQELHADTFETCGQTFLIGLVSPMQLVLVDNMPRGKTTTAKCITNGLNRFIGKLQSEHFDISEIHYDGAAKAELGDMPNMIIHPPGQHVCKAERAIRTLKEQLRTMVQSAPKLPWHGRFVVEAVKTAAIYINVRLSKAHSQSLTPFQQITGRTPSLDRDFVAAFGDMVMVEAVQDTKINLVEHARMVEAIWLRPQFDDHGSSLVWIPGSPKLMVRTNVKTGCTMTNDMLTKLTQWAGAPRTDILVAPYIIKGKSVNLFTEPPDPDDEQDELVAASKDGVLIPTRHEVGINMPDLTNAVLPSSRTPEESTPVLPSSLTPEESTTVLPSPLMSEESTTVLPSSLITEESTTVLSPSSAPEESMPVLPPTQVPEDFRARNVIPPQLARESAQDTLTLDSLVAAPMGRGLRRRTTSFKMLSTGMELVTHTIARSVKSALKLGGSVQLEAITACKDEIINLMVTHPALIPVHRSALNESDTVLPCSIFIDRKFVNGIYKKTKARLVAGGHRQDKEDFAELSTSTVNTESVMILLAITACENRAMAVVDVQGAYLNADMETPGGGNTFIKMPTELADLVDEIGIQTSDFRNNDGTLYLRIDKALYGCKQSSHLWQVKLTSTLIELGFTICSRDRCVAFNSSTGVIIAFHVDDLFITARTKWDIENFIKSFKAYFNVTASIGDELDYLGIHIVRKGQVIELSQHALVDKLTHGVKGTATSPMESRDASWRPQGPDAEPLQSNDAAQFRSIVATCLYLSKRTRPDILFAVNQLCRHAHNPSIQDAKDLLRLRRYLAKTKGKSLHMKCVEIRIRAYIDASFAMNLDRKSTTGALILLGEALLWAKSTKQTIVTKSSTEAELVALSDMLSMVLWMSLFLSELGYQTEAPIVFQDNMSTIHVANHGLTSNVTTKHIDIRRLWISQYLQDKQVIVSFVKTGEMVADGLTKPLTGIEFAKFMRDMNIYMHMISHV